MLAKTDAPAVMPPSALETRWNPRAKSAAMYAAILCTWILTLAWFDPRLLSLLDHVSTLPAILLVGAFIACLNAFWLFGAYYLMLFVFTRRAMKRPRVEAPRPAARPDVAILYVTMNDFDLEAARSCASQDYENCHVFVLDGSTKPSKVSEVDAFGRELPNRVTVCRRTDRTGFKAGSLNHALRTVAQSYGYFAVVDADGVVPRRFLSSLMPYFGLDATIGFVHGSHEPNPRQKTAFAAEFAPGLTYLWTLAFGPRNHYGFVPFLGHGAVVRRDVWERTGGFPEIVSEDLAFATDACQLGYRGYFASEVVSFEDFPATYRQLRKQQEKYVKGGCEYIRTHLGSFLRSKHVLLVEKLDVVFWLSTLFIPSIHLGFIAILTVLVVFVLGDPTPMTLAIGGTDVPLFHAVVAGAAFQAINAWDFTIFTVANMIAPMIGPVIFSHEPAIRRARLIVASTATYLSMMVVCTMAIVSYAITGRADFRVTGDDADRDRPYSGHDRGAHWWDHFDSSSRAMHVLELSVGLLLCGLSVLTWNFAFLAFALSLLLGVLGVYRGWERQHPILWNLPFLLLVLAMLSLGAGLVSAQTTFFMLPGLHF